MLYRIFFDAPLILTCISGLVLAILLFQRAPLPFLLTSIALGILLFTAVAWPIAHAYLAARVGDSLNHEQFALRSAVLVVFKSIAQATAVGLLIGAVSAAVLKRGTKILNPTH
jgi:hypothetical protein